MKWTKTMAFIAFVLFTLSGCNKETNPIEPEKVEEVTTETEEETSKEEEAMALFQQTLGYVQERNGLTVCELTEETLMCGILTVDSYAYAPIESVTMEDEQTLTLHLQDETTITLSSITEDSFDLFDRTFLKATGEGILSQLPYIESLDDYFSKESIEEVFQYGQGQHDLLQSWREEEQYLKEMNAPGDAVLFPGYTPEEIEYARMWHQYTNTSPAPPLTVLFDEKGTPVNPYIEDTSLVFPEDVVVLVGEFTAVGMVTYHSNGDGTVNVYDVPSHWHQDSDASMTKATERVLQTVTKKRVPKGNPEIIAEILQSMTIER